MCASAAGQHSQPPYFVDGKRPPTPLQRPSHALEAPRLATEADRRLAIAMLRLARRRPVPAGRLAIAKIRRNCKLGARMPTS